MSNFLYDNPELYEELFRTASDVCSKVFQKYLLEAPSSILDIGCGTGRELSELSEQYPACDCVGFDIHPAMVAVAKQNNPDLILLNDDMRSCRLGRTFDVIYSVGDTINSALSNDELCDTIKTYRAHARKGTLLLLEPLNPLLLLGKFRAPRNFSVPYKGTVAIGKVFYKLLKYQQIIERIRVWETEAEHDEIVDTSQFRLIFPAELTYFLSQQGFEVLEIFEKQRNVMYLKSMYVIAKYTG